eukprot:7310683-Pyramimonas_sp.AAC.1
MSVGAASKGALTVDRLRVLPYLEAAEGRVALGVGVDEQHGRGEGAGEGRVDREVDVSLL